MRHYFRKGKGYVGTSMSTDEMHGLILGSTILFVIGGVFYYIFVGLSSTYSWIQNFSDHSFPHNLTAGFYFILYKIIFAPITLGTYVHSSLEDRPNLAIVLSALTIISIYCLYGYLIKYSLNKVGTKKSTYIAAFFLPALLSLLIYGMAWLFESNERPSVSRSNDSGYISTTTDKTSTATDDIPTAAADTSTPTDNPLPAADDPRNTVNDNLLPAYTSELHESNVINNALAENSMNQVEMDIARKELENAKKELLEAERALAEEKKLSDMK